MFAFVLVHLLKWVGIVYLTECALSSLENEAERTQNPRGVADVEEPQKGGHSGGAGVSVHSDPWGPVSMMSVQQAVGILVMTLSFGFTFWLCHLGCELGLDV